MATVLIKLLQPLHFFKNSDGEVPCGSLVLGNDGYFYGMTANSAQNLPTIFKMTPAGNLTTVAYFNKTNGNMQNALTLGRDGAFYGTAGLGGNTNWNNGNGWGALFKLSTNGTLTTLANFDKTNGSGPENLILGPDGNFYGTTMAGGIDNIGTVFKVTTYGSLTALVSFTNVIDNVRVIAGHGGLTLGNDGNFYGTTVCGGITNFQFPNGFGTIFMVTSNGTLTTLTNFNGANGAAPGTALTLGNDGNFYGTTDSGGITNSQFPNGFGTIFMVTSNGTLTTLTNFNGANGVTPGTALTLGNDGNFYGTTFYGGNTNLNDGFGFGTIFKVTTNGVLTTLFSFSETNGYLPGALTLGSDGNFYGMTEYGGPGESRTGLWDSVLFVIQTIHRRSAAKSD